MLASRRVRVSRVWRSEAIFVRPSRHSGARPTDISRRLTMLANITALRVICQNVDASARRRWPFIYSNRASGARLDTALYISISIGVISRLSHAAISLAPPHIPLTITSSPRGPCCFLVRRVREHRLKASALARMGCRIRSLGTKVSQRSPEPMAVWKRSPEKPTTGCKNNV